MQIHRFRRGDTVFEIHIGGLPLQATLCRVEGQELIPLADEAGTIVELPGTDASAALKRAVDYLERRVGPVDAAQSPSALDLRGPRVVGPPERAK